jgi:hypothetical protein
MSKLERAHAGYDPAFESELAEVVLRAIVEASKIDGIVVLRTGETANALTSVLAATLALAPSAVRSPKAIREIADSVRRRLQARVHFAEVNPGLNDFRSRAFGSDADDRKRGGNA